MASKKGSALKKGKKLKASKSLRKTNLARTQLSRAESLREVSVFRAGPSAE